MARSCDQCGRHHLNSNRRSHSNIATKTKQRVNVQKKTIRGKSGNYCARCIRTEYKKTRDTKSS